MDEGERERDNRYPAVLAALLARFRPPWAPVILVGEGWWPLLGEVDAELSALSPDYRLSQVFEELSELALIADPGDGKYATGAFIEVLNAAMRRAERTCEVCGDRGRFVRQGRFFMVLCWDHAEERGAVPVRDGDDLDAVIPRLSDTDIATAITTGLPPRVYTRQGHADAVAWARRERQSIDAEMGSWLTTAEMSAALGLTADAVRQLARGDRLCSARRLDGRWAYPRWQLDTDGRLVRGLGEVLAAFAPGYDALAITHVVTRPEERFGGSALDWLCSGGDIDAVVRFVADLR